VIELLIIGFDADANAFKWQGGVWMVEGALRPPTYRAKCGTRGPRDLSKISHGLSVATEKIPLI